MSESDVETKLEAVFSLYQKHGRSDYIGEDVSQTEHMVQCAMLAEQEGFPVEVVLGALLHDVGHLVGMERNLERMGQLGVQHHERVGQTFLKELGFPAAVTDFVRGHVDAKRYRVYKEPTYYDQLSSASKGTLVHQGGPMTKQEAAEFEKSPQFQASLRMRSWDEAAKDPCVQIKPLQHYRELCRKYLLNL
ncbi:2-amino-1-hydroxyethylphosphonate dioxygenase (glycine-forming)-like [Branchiostoma lanceolatum]|uniref:2-amino-1-hydroxyethylphosphonate dioxygenase (glycine-forming)-like n=1 Tax=Branchiostoma lanceolatum TaxID=7740 RepID=UPI0034526C1D